jgi:hypothetical protein
VNDLPGWSLPPKEAEQVDACSQLHAKFMEKIEPAVPGRQLGAAETLLIAFWLRSVTTFEAIMVLADHGYGEQAAMLSRSLFENMVDAHWIVDDQDHAVDQFRRHEKHSNAVTAEVAARYPEIFKAGPPATAKLSRRERRELDRDFGRHGVKSWTGLTLHERVKVIEDQWPPATRGMFEFYKDIPLRFANQLLHPTSWGIGRGASLVESEAGKPVLRFNVGPSTAWISQALNLAFWTLIQLATLIMSEFDLWDEHELAEFADSLAGPFAAAQEPEQA